MNSKSVENVERRIFGEIPTEINLQVAYYMARAYLSDPILKMEELRENGSVRPEDMIHLQLASQYCQDIEHVCQQIGEGAHEQIKKYAGNFRDEYIGLFPIPRIKPSLTASEPSHHP